VNAANGFLYSLERSLARVRVKSALHADTAFSPGTSIWLESGAKNFNDVQTSFSAVLVKLGAEPTVGGIRYKESAAKVVARLVSLAQACSIKKSLSLI